MNLDRVRAIGNTVNRGLPLTRRPERGTTRSVKRLRGPRRKNRELVRRNLITLGTKNRGVENREHCRIRRDANRLPNTRRPIKMNRVPANLGRQ